MPAKISHDASRCESARFTFARKNLVVFAKPWLNGWKSFHSWSPALRRRAHSAGVSVSAVKPEITTATATVTANCL